MTDITGGLDLLGDWLDAKGYTEEAGLCTRVMDHMHKQDVRIAALEAALDEAIEHIGSRRMALLFRLRKARAAREGKDD